MDTRQIKELRETLLCIMDEIHRVCVGAGIQYYIIGGTALGAVRHKGFIPWDTDIDIAMRRDDYERFCKESNNMFNTNFFCANYMNTSNWYHPHALVFKTDTKIHWNRDYYKNKKDCPVYVDVFPLDYTPFDEKKKKYQEKRIRKMLYLQSRRECILYKRNGFMEQAIKKFLSLVLHCQSNYSFNRSLDRLMKKYSCGSCQETICSMASHYSYSKQCMPTRIYGKAQLVEFSGRQYYAPEHLEEYLTQLFGNYMELPPVERRSEYMGYIGYIDFGGIAPKTSLVIGYTTGVYDMFHIGHLNVIKKAKENCDYLIVGVSTDELVRHDKNKTPVIPFEERSKIVSAIKYVDMVVSQTNKDKVSAWRKYKFNKMFVGSDWKGTPQWKEYERQFEELGVEIVYLPHTDGISSTLLTEFIKHEIGILTPSKNVNKPYGGGVKYKIDIEASSVYKKIAA